MKKWMRAPPAGIGVRVAETPGVDSPLRNIVTPGHAAKGLILALGLLSGTRGAGAQARAVSGAIDGVVTDMNLVALADATASLFGSNVRVVTSANGRFRILGLPPGGYIVLVRRIGYTSISAPIDVTAGDTVRASFTLHRAVAALDTVTISEKGWSSPIEREFDERRRLGWGEFLTEPEIEKLNFVDLEDVLRIFRSVGSGGINTRASCQYQFFLDGVPLARLHLFEALPRPSEIFGIEVYASPSTIPLQFKTFGRGGMGPSGAFCGVILVWTRRGRS
jgi:hypothetical protein